MFTSFSSDAVLNRQIFALSAKLKALQLSDYQTDRLKAWRLEAKIRGLQNEMANRQMKLFAVRR